MVESKNAVPMNPGPTCVATAAETLKFIISSGLLRAANSFKRNSLASRLLAFIMVAGIFRGRESSLDRCISFIRRSKAVVICLVIASNFVRLPDNSITNLSLIHI